MQERCGSRHAGGDHNTTPSPQSPRPAPPPVRGMAKVPRNADGALAFEENSIGRSAAEHPTSAREHLRNEVPLQTAFGVVAAAVEAIAAARAPARVAVRSMARVSERARTSKCEFVVSAKGGVGRLLPTELGVDRIQRVRNLALEPLARQAKLP